MKNISLFLFLLLLSFGVHAQEFYKKILLAEDTITCESYQELELSIEFQKLTYGIVGHCIEDRYFKVYDHAKDIAIFYIDIRNPEKKYSTQIYKNYFLTYITENDKKYLVIEKSRLGKSFALWSKSDGMIMANGDLIEILIESYDYEWGYFDNPKDPNNYYDGTNYTINAKVQNRLQQFYFFNLDIKKGISFDLEKYKIKILSDMEDSSSHLIEMVICDK